MEIKINNNDTKVTVSFKVSEYVLVKNKEGEWTLNYLIDRSEKGKSPDIGLEVLHIESDRQLEIFKEAGFGYTEID